MACALVDALLALEVAALAANRRKHLLWLVAESCWRCGSSSPCAGREDGSASQGGSVLGLQPVLQAVDMKQLACRVEQIAKPRTAVAHPDRMLLCAVGEALGRVRTSGSPMCYTAAGGSALDGDAGGCDNFDIFERTGNGKGQRCGARLLRCFDWQLRRWLCR